MNLPSFVAPGQCPLCGQPNQCALETQRRTQAAQPPCWCTQMDFSGELLAKLPRQAIGRACICHDCASRARPG